MNESHGFLASQKNQLAGGCFGDREPLLMLLSMHFGPQQVPLIMFAFWDWVRLHVLLLVCLRLRDIADAAVGSAMFLHFAVRTERRCMLFFFFFYQGSIHLKIIE